MQFQTPIIDYKDNLSLITANIEALDVRTSDAQLTLVFPLETDLFMGKSSDGNWLCYNNITPSQAVGISHL